MARTLKFANGTDLALITCRGSKENFHDAYRDVLEFCIDPALVTLDEADALFTAENCATLILTDDEGQYTHEGYTERVNLEKAEKTVLTGAGEKVKAAMICVKMGQQTALERQLAELETANDILLGLEE